MKTFEFLSRHDKSDFYYGPIGWLVQATALLERVPETCADIEHHQRTALQFAERSAC